MTRARDAFARVALACAIALTLLAALGPACGKLEQLDRETDEFLDKVNNPGGGSSGSSSSRSTRGSSGLAVVKRDAMPVRTVKDGRGNPVELWGQSDSSSTTPGHDSTIAAEAVDMALSGKYEYITMQRAWRTATGRVSESRRIPDLIGVRHDGKVDAFEVRSKTDKEEALRERLKEGMETLPPERRGRFDVLDANR